MQEATAPFTIARKRGADFLQPYSTALYHILFFEGKGRYSLDFSEYSFADKHSLICFAPYQSFVWQGDADAEVYLFSFHSDFYCIEYHKKEVACNGLLFNNIYLNPHFSVSQARHSQLMGILELMQAEMLDGASPFSESVLRSYLQLILALCSREKQSETAESESRRDSHLEMTAIQRLIDTHYLRERSVSFYAAQSALSPNAFAKKTQLYFGKTPSQLIQDRVILEAKRQLHLTSKSIKEIAYAMHFNDEYYFSRYFKKCVGMSPLHYRNGVGISIV